METNSIMLTTVKVPATVGDFSCMVVLIGQFTSLKEADIDNMEWVDIEQMKWKGEDMTSDSYKKLQDFYKNMGQDLDFEIEKCYKRSFVAYDMVFEIQKTANKFLYV